MRAGSAARGPLLRVEVRRGLWPRLLLWTTPWRLRGRGARWVRVGLESGRRVCGHPMVRVRVRTSLYHLLIIAFASALHWHLRHSLVLYICLLRWATSPLG